MSSATWTINAKIVMSGLNVFNIYYTKTLKKCLQLQDEVLYIPVYIYIYKRLKWFVKQHQVHKTKW